MELIQLYKKALMAQWALAIGEAGVMIHRS